jgi:biopolymer transport protein ExbD
MDLTDQPRPPRGESIVPMINVVFLLLIFFLMTSHLTPPEPFDVEPPKSEIEAEPTSELTLFLDKDGHLAFEEERADAAIARIAALAEESGEAGASVQLRADARAEARTVARILRQLSGAGLGRVELLVAPK